MAFAQLNLTLQGIESAARKLGQLAAFDQEDLMNDIGGLLLSTTVQRITADKQGPQGEVWDPWSDRYAKKRHAGHSLLEGRGHLRDSIGNISSGLIASVSVHVQYGAIHQFGGKAGRDHSATIPARPYLGISDEDRRAITALVTERLEAALS